MEQSRVMQNADFLRELGHANYIRQHVIIQRANQRQISALSDVVRHLLDRTIPILSHDRSFFRQHNLVMRTLSSSRVSVSRKKRTLLTHYTLIPSLLRDYYLARILILTIRNSES